MLSTFERYQRIARVYDVLDLPFEYGRYRQIRRLLYQGLAGRLLEYVRPQHTIRRALARLWEPWIAWAYGASFDRRTEERIPAAGLQIHESRFVVPDLMKFISVRVGRK